MSNPARTGDQPLERRPAPEKRRWQFGLRTMMSLCVVAACYLWAWTSFTRPHQENRRAIERVEERGGSVKLGWFGPRWLDQLGYRSESCERVVAIDLSNSRDLVDGDLAVIAGLQELQVLDLRETAITGAGCDHLRHLPKLTHLYASNTRVTKLAGLGDFPSLQVVELGNVKRYDLSEWPPKTSILASEGTGEISVLRMGGIEMEGLTAAVAPESEALLNVEGPGSYCQVSRNCDLGMAGRATVQVQDGGLLEIKRDLCLGNNPAGNGTLTLAGARAWIRGDMTVGNGGTGTVDVAERSEVTCNGSIAIGNGEKPGVVRCSGSLSSSELIVGSLGEGTLEVREKGRAIVGKNLILGQGISSRGTLSVARECTLEVKGDTDVGGQGAAQLRLAAGAQFSTQEIKIGPRGELHGATRLPKTTNQGLVAPGGPEATLVIEGAPTMFLSGYEQMESGGLRVEIEANRSTRVKAEGVAKLAGRLELHLKGPKPPPGTSYVILSAHRVEGRFQKVLSTGDAASEDWQVTYTPAEVRVTFAPRD